MHGAPASSESGGGPVLAAARARRVEVTRFGPWRHLSSRGLASGQTGLWVVGRELLSGVLVDEALVQEPFDGAALGSDVTQGVPGRDQLGKVLVELVLEPTERSRAPAAPWPGVVLRHRR